MLTKSKWIYSVLAIFLAFSLLLPTVSWAETGFGVPADMTFEDILKNPHMQLYHAVLNGDTFYALMADGSMRTWKPGEPEVDFLPAGSLPTDVILAAGGGDIYLFDRTSGNISRVTGDGAEPLPIKPDILPLLRREESRVNGQGFVISGKLCMLADYDEEGGGLPWNNYLAAIDLNTGAVDLYRTSGTEGLYAYKEGMALLFRTFRDGEAFRYKLSQINVLTGELTDLNLSMPDSNPYTASTAQRPAYDAANDTIYYIYENQLFASRLGGAFAQTIYMPGIIGTASPYDIGWALPDGRYATRNDGLKVYDPQDSSGPLLHVSGFVGPVFHFTQQNPDTPVIMHDKIYSSAEVSQAIAGGDSGMDVYAVWVDSAFTALKEKGYAMDLGESETLLSMADDLYPFAHQAVANSAGRVMATPVHFTMGMWSYATELYQTYFGDEPLPTTFAAFFDLMARFENDFAAEHPEHVFLEFYNYAELVEWIVKAYIRQYETAEAPLDFQTHALLEALQKLAAVGPHRLEVGAADAMAIAEMGSSESIPIFSIFQMHGWGPLTLRFSVDEDRFPSILPMTFQAGETPVLSGEMMVLFVNPHTQNKAAALRLLEHAAFDQDDIRMYYYLHQSANTAYENHYYEENKNVPQWLIRQSDVDAYQAIVPFISLSDHSKLLGAADDQLKSLCGRYCEGGLTLDQFLAELTRVYDKVYREGR